MSNPFITQSGSADVDLVSVVLVLLYAGGLIAATFTDLRSRRIPNLLTIPALGLALVVAAVHGNLLAAIVGALLAGAAFVLPALLYGKGTAGGGDVKLAAFVGAAVWWPPASRSPRWATPSGAAGRATATTR